MNTNEEKTTKKQDIINLAILLAIALAIGLYLIFTTVMVAKDGIFYIERAQKFSTDPIGIIKGHPFGYPLMIFLNHKLLNLVSNTTSPQHWIYTAQITTLLCKIAAFIPLYFIGKILVGQKNSFLALLILNFLPYPTEFASDALRDWPLILFLALGFWAILWGAKNHNSLIFALAGLAAGIGYMVKQMCLQLVVCGIIWLIYSFLRAEKNFNRKNSTLALAMLFLGFLIPVAPYTVIKGTIMPDRYHGYAPPEPILSGDFEKNTPETKEHTNNNTPIKYSAGLEIEIHKAAEKFVKKTCENLMWFFVLPLLVGIYYHFQKNATQEELILITSLVVVNLILLFLRFYRVGADISHRYILPLTIFTIFYIPIGLKLISFWLLNMNKIDLMAFSFSSEKVKKLFSTLLIIGICICLPKLIRPIRIEKKGYRSAANWLKNNTEKSDVIAVPDDRRFAFYSNRKGIIYKDGKIDKNAKYILQIKKTEQIPAFYGNIKEVYSAQINPRKKMGKKVVIYKRL